MSSSTRDDSPRSVSFWFASMECYSYLRALAKKELGGRGLTRFSSSDVAQMAHIRAVTRAHQFEGTTERQCRAWLKRICRRVVLSTVAREIAQVRDLRRELNQAVGTNCLSNSALLSALPAGDPTPSRMMIMSENAQFVATQLTQLPASYKEVIERRYFRGERHAAIAHAMGLTPLAARALLSRARRMLFHQLKSCGDRISPF